MRKLSELGISPAPWRVSDAQHYWIEDANRKMVCDGLTFRGNGENADAEERANARLIASAPELYDMLQSLVEYIDRECIPCGETACELLAAAHNVLSKAAGEEVGDGK